MEGRSTAGDGLWPVRRTEVWRRSVPIRCCGMRSPQKPEWTGHVYCSKSFKLGSMFELGAFSGDSNSVQTSGGRTRAFFAEVPFPGTQSKGGHGMHRLRRLTASAWRHHGMNERCD
jgi:hypothetical protein